MELFADIILDISHSSLDKTFQYRVPERLVQVLEPGNVVEIPFGAGDRLRTGYVMGLSEHPKIPLEKMKEIQRIVTDFAGTDSKLTALALWMRDYYGSTTAQALRTVLPMRKKTAPKQKKTLVRLVSGDEAEAALAVFKKKNQKARVRLWEALLAQPRLPYEAAIGGLGITPSVIKALEERKLLACESDTVYRRPFQVSGEFPGKKVCLTQEQEAVIEEIAEDTKECGNYLIHGVTGSGKTEVYMELIARTVSAGKQAILLIPEISLTYQNVMRFYSRFGERVSVLHSRLSQGERYDQFERARSGGIDVMIGPRSALFTPFPNLGMIIIDEEHEPSYQSETSPRYHARETAVKRGELEGAKVVLGSATPSMEAYYGAKQGKYRLLCLQNRPGGGQLPRVEIVDLKKELRQGNKSVLSKRLHDKLEQCLDQGKQAMLFLNRRGYAGFVSCRSCGHVIKCPHCDVSLSLHRGGRLFCHYCGYSEPAPSKCPKCGSPFIGSFRAGTQQIEKLVSEAFPGARILRMDADTTKGKEGHQEILKAFGEHQADILIGTQMIVKGHDFPQVTLMGVLAADLSLHISDYRAAERTFQLLTQAAGRAGRGADPGEVVIQTYDPEHYAVVCGAAQDYESFYRQEIIYRQLAGYPPAGGLLAVHCMCQDQERLELAASYLGKFARQAAGTAQAAVMGPADEILSKINDVYRKVLYVKHSEAGVLIRIKNLMEQYISINDGFKGIQIHFEHR